jgi:hypothetical protein
MTCVTFDEWSAIVIGMQAILVMTNIVVAALIVENRFKLARLLKAHKVPDAEDVYEDD